ncbi:unnamed protein product [Urochloa humidicola]
MSWPRPFAEQVRCVYCEDQGDRILHPAKGIFRGCAEFELYVSKADFYTNDEAIKSRKDHVYGVEDEEIYCNYRVCDDDEGFGEWRKVMQIS